MLLVFFPLLLVDRYLAEDQLKGPSKVEMYITALTKGCRCVECEFCAIVVL